MSELWKPHDKQWMSERKLEWRRVQKSLDVMINIKKKHHKYHKELFFTGSVDESDHLLFSKTDELGGGVPFDFIKFYYYLWYHPKPSAELFKSVYEAQTDSAKVHNAREMLFKYQTQKFQSEYGMLGGREELFVKTLLPSHNYEDVRVFKKGSRGLPLCLHPELLGSACLRGTQPILYGNTFNPYAPGQYLWDYYSDIIHKIDLNREYLRDKVLFRVKNYPHLEKFHKNNPVSVNLAKSLKKRFDNEEFSPLLLEVYAEAESLD